MVTLARERAAFTLLIFLAIAFSLLRMRPTDTPWHMATARLAFETGAWPTENTFSYTYPDFPLFQQYPVYQSLLYLTYRVGGWDGLSILHCAAWTGIFLLWVRWGAPWNYACMLSLAFLVALLGLQRRMVLRPDLMTLLLLACLLHLIDGYRRGRRLTAVGLVFVQWLMANSHQLFPLGLAVQTTFLGHLVVTRVLNGRFGVSREDVHLPVWPIALALVGSGLACLGTPLGLTMLWAPFQTAGSLEHHREHVSEFRFITADPYALQLVLIAGALALYGFYCKRRDWSPFELGLFLMGTALVLAAQRGAAFFILIAVGIYARSMTSLWQRGEISPALAHPPFLSFRSVTPLVCLLLSLFFLQIRWRTPVRSLTDTQPGVGKAKGMFPDAAVAFLKANPPPGRMLNLGWYAGNLLVWELYPQHAVFVDPRFEAYPRQFLLDTIHAMDDRETLQRLIAEHQPGWIVAELRIDGARKRAAELLKEGHWKLVFADAVWLILVRKSPESEEYLQLHATDPEKFEPAGLLYQDPELLRLQQEELAAFRRALESTPAN